MVCCGWPNGPNAPTPTIRTGGKPHADLQKRPVTVVGGVPVLSNQITPFRRQRIPTRPFALAPLYLPINSPRLLLEPRASLRRAHSGIPDGAGASRIFGCGNTRTKQAEVRHFIDFDQIVVFHRIEMSGAADSNQGTGAFARVAETRGPMGCCSCWYRCRLGGGS